LLDAARRWFGFETWRLRTQARRKEELLAVLLSLAATFFVNYFRCQGCVTFRIRGLQVSLTKTKDKVF
jgi:hypothetical protein